jgi:hypothetical protein
MIKAKLKLQNGRVQVLKQLRKKREEMEGLQEDL